MTTTNHSTAREDALLRTRRGLHGIGECLMAGPQRRAGGRFTLRVTPGGFATTGEPALRLDGVDLVAAESARRPASGTFGELAGHLGVEFGAPPDGYPDGSGALIDDEVVLDPGAAALISQWFLRGDAALRMLAPRETPILWPEHFDVAIVVDDHSIGVSAGDDYHLEPYAYVSARAHGPSEFWNAPFGAVLSHEDVDEPADLVGFWRTGLHLLSTGG